MASENFDSKEKQELDRLLTLANVQRLREQYTEAESTCRKALELVPDDVAAKEMLADLLLELGKKDEALAEYKSALEIAPGKESLEDKYAKLIIVIAEDERQKEIAKDMINNPHKYTMRKKNPIIAWLLASLVPGMGQFYNGQNIKGAVIFGIFMLFIIVWAGFSSGYSNIDNIQDLILSTNPLVLTLGFINIVSYIYGIFDAVLVAVRSSMSDKIDKKM